MTPFPSSPSHLTFPAHLLTCSHFHHQLCSQPTYSGPLPLFQCQFVFFVLCLVVLFCPAVRCFFTSVAHTRTCLSVPAGKLFSSINYWSHPTACFVCIWVQSCISWAMINVIISCLLWIHNCICTVSFSLKCVHRMALRCRNVCESSAKMRSLNKNKQTHGQKDMIAQAFSFLKSRSLHQATDNGPRIRTIDCI